MSDNSIDLYKNALADAQQRLQEALEGYANAGVATRGDWENQINALKKKITTYKKLLAAAQQEEGITTEGSTDTNNKVLFLSANTKEGEWLRLEEEQRYVQQALEDTAVELVLKPASRIEDLQQALVKHQPQWIHFSGHGSSQGLAFLNPQTGGEQQAPYLPLAYLLSLFPDLQGIFLNACFSATIAQGLKQLLPTATIIVMESAIKDDTAVHFAKTFYQTLGAGKDPKFAFELAKNSIDLHGLPGSHIPLLL